MRVLPFKSLPATRHVRGTNLCLIAVHPDRAPDRAILLSVDRQPGQGRLRPGAAEHERDARPARDRRASTSRPVSLRRARAPAWRSASPTCRPPPAQLEGQVVRTPCLRSQRLSEVLGAEITLKFETFQHCSSFKDRGACVKLASLTEEERARGVIAMSAGNHAQGVAYHATAARHSGDHRDAAPDAVREGRADRAVRRQGRARGRFGRRRRRRSRARSRPSAT